MNLYLISQDENTGYDTYDSAVVVAYDEDQARRTHPNGDSNDWEDNLFESWCSSPEKVTVKLIGKAAEWIAPGVICASFNAG